MIQECPGCINAMRYRPTQHHPAAKHSKSSASACPIGVPVPSATSHWCVCCSPTHASNATTSMHTPSSSHIPSSNQAVTRVLRPPPLPTYTRTAAAAAGRYRNRQTPTTSPAADVVIAPIDPLDLQYTATAAAAAVHAGGRASNNSSSNASNASKASEGSSAAAAAAQPSPVLRPKGVWSGGRPGRPTTSRHDGRRGSLVKIRVAPRRYKLRRSFDSPRPLHVRPSDPDFEGRLTSEINSVYGPRRLNKLIQDFSPHFTPAHAAAAVSLLVGMVTGQQQLTPAQLDSNYRGPAAKVARVFQDQLQQATLQDCARMVYSLARLQLHLPALLSAVEAASQGQLASATPQALAGLSVGLAHWGHRPSAAWLQELCLMAYTHMDGFSAQDLANLMFSLAVWRCSVSQPFLLRTLTAFRGHWGAAATTPAALTRCLYGLTQLPACQPLPPKLRELQPPHAPVYLHHETYRQQKQLQVLSGVMGLTSGGGGGGGGVGSGGGEEGVGAGGEAAAAVVSAAVGVAAAVTGSSLAQADQEQPSTTGDSNSSSSSSSKRRKRSGSSSSSAVATYRLPSFNWLTAYLSEARRLIDRFKPAELSTLLYCCACLNHTPDLVFMEAWFRASAARMPAFTPPVLAAALQALGLLQPGREVRGALPGRWLQPLLTHSQQMLREAVQQQQQQQQQGQQGRDVGSRQQQRGQDLVESRQQQQPQPQQQQPQQKQQQQPGGSPVPLWSASDLSKVLWGLAELRVWPGSPWLDDWLEASAGQLQAAAPADLSDMVWALARLRVTPHESWMRQLTTAINRQLEGFNVQGLAVVIWGYSRLGVKPDRTWLVRFRALAAAAPDGGGRGSSSSSDSSSGVSSSSSSSGGERLAQFVAAFLAQQNRQRFAEPAARTYGTRAAAVAAAPRQAQQRQRQQRWQQQQEQQPP